MATSNKSKKTILSDVGKVVKLVPLAVTLVTAAKSMRKKSAPKLGRKYHGMATYAIHSGDTAGDKIFAALKNERPSHPGFTMARAVNLKSLDAEAAATRHLNQAFASSKAPRLTAPKFGNEDSEFKSLGAEAIPLTGTTTVKFRQYFHKIPVYSSLVTVELDENNECLAINSAVGVPTNVDPIAKVGPAAALKTAMKAAGHRAGTEISMPRLYYYFDNASNHWRLVYIVENLAVHKSQRKAGEHLRPALMDYVVDAHTGTIVAELPRTPSLSATAKDGLNANRTFEYVKSGAAFILRDDRFNIHTYDFGFGDPDFGNLPGSYVRKQPTGWNPMAISAHANAVLVAKFLSNTLKRQNIDNKGGALRSSINCVVVADSEAPNEWYNAYWNGDQMVYGQVKVNGQLRSLAVSLDIVGHEMFHGVTDMTSRLEYADQSGALNESFSDVFGVLISNFSIADIGKWDWEVGEGMGEALRNMANPAKFDQPKHMKDYANLPNTEKGDWGGVHTNSGITNRAAYLVMTAKTKNGKFVFTPTELAAIFYLGLTQYLSRHSTFGQCRTAVEMAAKTYFRKDSPAIAQEKLLAISRAYSSVGIKTE